MGVLITGAEASKEKWRDFYITPPWLKEAVTEAFGRPFFDPCPEDPQWDALKRDWPPYSYINGPFSEYKDKGLKWFTHGLKQPGPQIWVGHSNTETVWYQYLAKRCTRLCLLKGRVKFIDPRTKKVADRPTQASTVFYKGYDCGRFEQAFSKLGLIVMPVGF